MNISKRIKEKRLARGLSMDKLSDLSGVDKSLISRVESGLCIPTVPVLFALAAALDMNAADVIVIAAGEEERI